MTNRTVPAGKLRAGDQIVIMGSLETITHYVGTQRVAIRDGVEEFGHVYGIDNEEFETVCFHADFPVHVFN